jgi:hypothetical protein
MLVRQVEKKVDQAQCDREIEHNRQQFEHVKKIATDALKRAGEHSCMKKSEIHEMKKDVRSWELWFRRAVFGFIGFLIVVGSGWLWQFFTLQSSVAKTEKSWEEVSTNVKTVQDSQAELREIVQKKVINGDATKDKDEDRRVKEIHDMLDEIVNKKKRQR